MDADGKGADIKSEDWTDDLVSTSATSGVIEVDKGAVSVTGTSACGGSLATGSGAGAGGVTATSWAEMAATVSPVWESTTTVAGGPAIVWIDGCPSASVP